MDYGYHDADYFILKIKAAFHGNPGRTQNFAGPEQ